MFRITSTALIGISLLAVDTGCILTQGGKKYKYAVTKNIEIPEIEARSEARLKRNAKKSCVRR
jgi:hypothetical protein